MAGRPLRIALDVRHVRDFGIGTYIRNLTHALGSLDGDERFLLIGRLPDLDSLATKGPRFEPMLYGYRDEEWVDQGAFPVFCRQLRADLVHIPLNVVPWMMPRPYVVTVHDMNEILYGPRGSTGFRANLRMLHMRRGLERASRVIAVSGATQRAVEGVFDRTGGRVVAIPNGIDARFLPEGFREDDARDRRLLERYQIDPPYLLYAGTIRPHKNLPRLVEAFAVLRGELGGDPRFAGLRLVIIGDELSKFPALRRTVIQTRQEDAVRFLGFVPVETLRAFYRSASAFVFPSLSEGFGLPPLEAMACGAPVVTSNLSALPEVVGDAAVLVNPENVFDIARGLREVLLDDELRAALVLKGRLQVTRFSWDRTAREVLRIYRTVGNHKG
jgi:glycosyltransferase involved in cell wall biosynthesis